MLCLLVIRHWFSDNSFIYYVDSFVPIDPKNSFIRLYYNLDSHVFPWNSETSWSGIIYWLMLSFGSVVFKSLSISQYLLYVFLLSSSVMGFYFLVNYLWTEVLGNRNMHNLYLFFSFFFALLYTFNLYTFYYAFFMFNPDAYIIAFLPFNILSLFKIYSLDKAKANSNKSFWLIAFFGTLILMSPGFGTYIFLAQYFVWITLYLVIYFLTSRTKIISLNALSLFLFLLLIILSQWWWFFPAILGFRDLYEFQSSTGTISWFKGGFEPAQLLNSLRILGIPMMVGNPFSWSDYYTANKLFTLPLFFLPALLLFFLASLKKIKSRTTLLYLTTMLLISLFIVKFSNPPFSFILGLAFEHVPYFGAFREFYHKAGIYYIFPYFLILSIAAALLFGRVTQLKNKLYLVLFSLALFITGIIITGPFFLFRSDNIRNEPFTYQHKNYNFNAKTKIPPEYTQLKKVFEPECKGKAVMVVPRGAWISSANWFKYGTSYMGVDLLSQTIDCSFVTTLALKPKSEASNQVPYVLLQNNEYDDFKSYLYKTQISFVLIRHDNIPYYASNWLYINPKEMMKRLDLDTDFEKKDINEYFTVYRYKKLDKISTFGFALQSKGAYANSLLTKPTDYAILSKKTPDVIGSAVISTSKDRRIYESSIGTYISIGTCEECDEKGEIDRLITGTKKRMSLSLDIVKEGDYLCNARVYVPGSKVKKLLIKEENKGQTEVDFSRSIPLSRRRYLANIFYTTEEYINKKSIIISPEEIIELPVGKLMSRNYRLSYKLKNPDQEVEVILAIKRLNKKEIQEKQFKPENVLFNNPLGPSDKDQISDRIFQADEFNINNYWLYIRGGPGIASKKSKAEISDLMLERAVDTNHVAAFCSMVEGESEDFTGKLKVSQITPLEYKVILPNTFKKGFLTFNKTFADDWEARGRLTTYPHFQSGYANGWFIENSSNREVTVVLARHESIKKNGFITLLVFVGLLILYIVIRKKYEK
ncbi:MAG: hypothetical protein ACD_37C00188G0003 [uncultured bacterium]|nr:MAG: hypothetical protein ACD_37C00188G0003 [uncultured bacterium]